MVRRVLSVCYEQCLPPSTLEFLEAHGCNMKCAREIGAAIQFFESLPFDLILINQTVSSSQEHLIVDIVREQDDHLPIIFVSAESGPIPGVNALLRPPVKPDELLRVIVDLVPDGKSRVIPGAIGQT